MNRSVDEEAIPYTTLRVTFDRAIAVNPRKATALQGGVLIWVNAEGHKDLLPISLPMTCALKLLSQLRQIEEAFQLQTWTRQLEELEEHGLLKDRTPQ